MSADDVAGWRRVLGEASCLAPEDPERQAVEADVARGGAWAEREWLAHLEEAERWRLELRRVDVPPGLLASLERIPRDAGVRSARRRLQPALLALAALVVVALGAFLALRERAPGGDPLNTLAVLAVNDHLHTHTLEVTESEPGRLEQGLQPRIPFPVRLPDLGAGLVVEGGRRCTLGTHTVCFSSWLAGTVRLTLIQMRRTDFDLPADMPPRVVTPDAAAVGGRVLDVLVWSDGPDAYALVADEPALLRRLAPRAR